MMLHNVEHMKWEYRFLRLAIRLHEICFPHMLELGPKKVNFINFQIATFWNQSVKCEGRVKQCVTNTHDLLINLLSV